MPYQPHTGRRGCPHPRRFHAPGFGPKPQGSNASRLDRCNRLLAAPPDSRPAGLGGPALAGDRFGLRRRGLGVLAQGPLPPPPPQPGLGQALAHPYVTTDFSEALLELITPPTGAMRPSPGSPISTASSPAPGESLWGTSIPANLQGSGSIPLVAVFFFFFFFFFFF